MNLEEVENKVGNHLYICGFSRGFKISVQDWEHIYYFKNDLELEPMMLSLRISTKKYWDCYKNDKEIVDLKWTLRKNLIQCKPWTKKLHYK